MRKTITNNLKKLVLPFAIGTTLIGDSLAQGYKWGNVSMGGGGFVSGLLFSAKEQNTAFARTDVGGAYRWNSTTSTWIPLLDWTSESETSYQGVESIAIDPNSPNKFYALVGTEYFNSGKSAILRSVDYGATFAITDVTSQFKAHGNGMGRQNGERLQVDPNNGNILFCGTRANGLFKSTNSGAAWSKVNALSVSTTSNANGICFLVFDRSTGTSGNATQTFFVGVSQTGTNLYVTTNGGTTFSAVPNAPTGFMPQRAIVDKDRNLIVTYADKEGPWNITSGQIWKYSIPNNSWTNITPSGFTFGFSGISVDPNNSQRLIASSLNAYWPQYNDGVNTQYGDRFFLSTNGGSSWRDLVGSNMINMNANGCTWINGQSIHWTGCIEFNPFNSNQAWVISGNGIFTCDDVNATKTTWKFNAKGVEETVPLDIASITGGPLVSVIGDFDGFKHTDITQYAPVHTPRMGTTRGLAFAALSTNNMVRVGGNKDEGGKMYYTTNQGNSWTATSSVKGYEGKVALSANGNVLLHCAMDSTTTYRSTLSGGAYGASWTKVTGLSIANAVPVADMVNANKFYAYNSNNGTMYVSTNAGVSFTAAGSPGSWGSQIIRTVPGKEGHIWVALYDGGLTRSVNSGTNFTKINSVSKCSAVGLGKAANGATYHTIYIWGTVNGVLGVHRSTDEGSTWTRVNDDEHEYGGPGNGQFVIGDMNVYGRVYMSTVGRGIAYGDPSVTTSTEEIVSYLEANEKQFANCYPNPFQSNFTLQSKGAFDYAIYDMAGNDLEKGNGENQTQAGKNLPSGVYMVKIKNEQNTAYMKVVKQ
jgi:xyloglucan-specific exo-beta-1,4-glucanase